MTHLFACRGNEGKSLAYPLLAEAVRLTWGWDSLPALSRSPRGKPFFPQHPDRWFSLSHSGGLALCALSDDGPVGVDIERVRPRREGLFTYALAPEELERFDGTWGDFYRLWTLKESWCKREDIPLYPPRQLMTPPPCPHRCFIGADWRAAVCCCEKTPEEVVWLPAPKILIGRSSQ